MRNFEFRFDWPTADVGATRNTPPSRRKAGVRLPHSKRAAARPCRASLLNSRPFAVPSGCEVGAVGSAAHLRICHTKRRCRAALQISHLPLWACFRPRKSTHSTLQTLRNSLNHFPSTTKRGPTLIPLRAAAGHIVGEPVHVPVLVGLADLLSRRVVGDGLLIGGVHTGLPRGAVGAFNDAELVVVHGSGCPNGCEIQDSKADPFLLV